MLHKFEKIPESRDELARNELPICQHDIRTIAQVHGDDVAETVRFATQRVKHQGGVNPHAVETIIPEGKDGPLDEEQLFRCVGNLLVWWEYQDKTRR